MISAVIVAGGKGKRMGQGINKQFIKLGDREILAITLEAFNNSEIINEIVVVISDDEIEFCRRNIVEKYQLNKVVKIIPGGSERQESVYNGLKECSANTEIVLIHDGARPFITKSLIAESASCASESGACTVAVPIKDTLKMVDSNNRIVGSLKREEIYSIQTPQAFKMDLIMEGHRRAYSENWKVTDDTSIVEKMGQPVKVVLGTYFNIKLTTPEDLIIGESILRHMNLRN